MARTACDAFSLASGAHAVRAFPNSHLVGAVPASWAAPKEVSAMEELRQAVRDEDWPRNFEEGLTKIQMRAEWSASEDRCALLKWLVKSTQAKRVLEIGSFCGVGTLALAESMPEDGELFSLELDPFVVNFGRRFGGPALTRAKTILGQAADSLQQLAHEGKEFDLVIVDADKEGMCDYFELLWKMSLVSPRAVVAVDMTPFKGQPPLRFLKFGFPYRCETSSGEKQINELRTHVQKSSDFTSHEFGGLLIVQKMTSTDCECVNCH